MFSLLTDSRYFLLLVVMMPVIGSSAVAFFPAHWVRRIWSVLLLVWGIEVGLLSLLVLAFLQDHVRALWWGGGEMIHWHMGFEAGVLSLMAAFLGMLLWSVGILCAGDFLRSSERFRACVVAMSAAVSGWMGVAFSGDLITLSLGYLVLFVCVYGALFSFSCRQLKPSEVALVMPIVLTALCGLVAVIAVSAYHSADVRFLKEGALASFVTPREGARFVVYALLGFGGGWMVVLGGLWLRALRRESLPMLPLMLWGSVVGSAGLFAWYKITWLSLGDSWFRGEWLSATVVSRGTLIGVSFVMLGMAATAWLTRSLSWRVFCMVTTHAMLGFFVMLVLPPLAMSVSIYHFVTHVLGASIVMVVVGSLLSSERSSQFALIRGWRIPLVLALLAWIGVPPLSGFLTLWWVHSGEWDGGWFWYVEAVMASVAVLLGLSSLSLWRACEEGFGVQHVEKQNVNRERYVEDLSEVMPNFSIRFGMQSALWLLALLLVLWSVFPGALLMVLG